MFIVKISSYLPLIHPLTAKAPTRRLDAIIEYSTLELRYPLVFIADNFL